MADAPASLRERMLAALGAVNSTAEIHEQLGAAAALCLERAMAGQTRRTSAMDLLAADALMTHACEAAAEAGSHVLDAFAGEWNATRLGRLLPAATT